jgi:hypothetical protein
MMNKSPRELKESFKLELILFASTSIFVLLLSFKYSLSFLLFIEIIVFFITVFVHILRPRKCPDCNCKMTADFKGALLPWSYTCPKCKGYINLKITPGNW